MTELRFHGALYRRASVDEAIERFTPFGELELSEDGDYICVRVGASSEARAARIAAELANFALGLTIESRTLAGVG